MEVSAEEFMSCGSRRGFRDTSDSGGGIVSGMFCGLGGVGLEFH